MSQTKFTTYNYKEELIKEMKEENLYLLKCNRSYYKMELVNNTKLTYSEASTIVTDIFFDRCKEGNIIQIGN